MKPIKNQAPTPFTQVKRRHERGVYERDAIYAILDEARMCHVGHVIDGRPVVIPTLHWREGDRIYWHGSAASRMLEANQAGGAVCLSVSLMDGWVLARSAFNHSVNYRSVLCFGTPEAVLDHDHKMAALETMMAQRFPGRWQQLRPVQEKELKATLVLSMPIDEVSAKIRAEGPLDDVEDLAWPVWAGVLPLRVTRAAPEPDALPPGLAQLFAPPSDW